MIAYLVFLQNHKNPLKSSLFIQWAPSISYQQPSEGTLFKGFPLKIAASGYPPLVGKPTLSHWVAEGRFARWAASGPLAAGRH